jgi:hypothetical protein
MRRIGFIVAVTAAMVAGSFVPAVAAPVPVPAPAPAAPGQAPASYGAIAYSPADKPGDLSYGRASSATAQQAVDTATSDCYQRVKAADCQSYVWFQNGYGSLARAGNAIGSVGSGWGPTAKDADNHALSLCREEGGGDACHVTVQMLAGIPSASAQGGMVGRGCLFRARPLGGFDGYIQHVGWAFRDLQRGNNPWTMGGTEGRESVHVLAGHWNVAPGNDAATQARSWASQQVTWSAVKAKFYQGPFDVGQGYYVDYRCRDVAASNADQAWAKWSAQAAQGYGVGIPLPDWLNVQDLIPVDNNCLTHAVETLRAYGMSDLPSGSFTTPQWYFDQRLSNNFLPAATLP